MTSLGNRIERSECTGPCENAVPRKQKCIGSSGQKNSRQGIFCVLLGNVTSKSFTMASNKKIESLLKSLDLKVSPDVIVQIKDLLEKIEASSISSNSFDIDFTDTLSYITEEDYGIDRGKSFIDGLGWVPIQFNADNIGSILEDDDVLFQKLLFDGELDTGMGVVPVSLSGDALNVKSGDYSGSFMSSGILKDPFGSILNESYLSVQNGSDNRSYRIGTLISSGGGDVVQIVKENESGEIIGLILSFDGTGFVIGNHLSDDTASVLRIEDNNGDAILEFFNDYLVSETIPALDYADDAAAALGGVPVGGIYHNSGTIRIRLT